MGLNPQSEIRNPKSEIGASLGWVSLEEIQELDRLSREQGAAARAGDLEQLRFLLGSRQRLLDGFRGRVVPLNQLAPLTALDAETRELLEAQARHLEASLARLREGRQVLRGYTTRIVDPPGFVDQVR